MKLRTPKLLLVVALVVVVAVLGTAAAPAAQQQLAAPIYLRAGVFTPARGEALSLAAGLSVSDYAPNQAGYYLLQFRGPVEQAWKDEMAALGIELLDYIPDFAFKVRMNPAQAAQARQSANVAWVGIFQPGYKLNPDLLTAPATGQGAYLVTVERGANVAGAAAAVARGGATVLGQDGNTLLVAADKKQLVGIASVLDVAWVDASSLIEKHNEYGGGQVMGANTANANGYDGSTQIVAVADTGLGGGTAATAHVDIPSSRIVSINNWPGVSDSCWTIINDGAVDVDSGHGTHTALSVVSDGGPAGEGKGTAPAARLVFQAVENWADMIGICALLYPDGYYLTGLNDLNGLYQQAYNAGARIHSNSWGSDSNGQYTANSVTTDTFIWNNQDMLITFSAGNSGEDANNDGVVDNDSIGAPATAKNVLTVGASEGDRQGNYQCDTSLTYTSHDAYQSGQTCNSMGGNQINFLGTAGSRWGFSTEPLKSDVTAGNANQMAPFSSRGPVDDGRLKPDVVAPGTWILSGYSSLHQEGYGDPTNPRNGAYQSDGWGMPRNQDYKYFGGTSMANPLAAGGAAVVRDFYQKAYAVNASAALVKASLINSATDLLDENNDGVNDNDFPIPNNHEGWGLVNLVNATDGTAQFVDATTGLATGGNVSFNYTVNAGTPLKVTLVWSDYPSTTSASVNLVNDLDLTVTAPGGAVYRGNVFSGGWSATGGTADRLNNVENVYLQAPAAGIYTVTITGFNVPQSTQKYALVVDASFDTGGPTATPTNTPLPPTATNTPTATATATNTPTATATPSNTGLLSPSTNAAQTSSAGDNNGYEVNAANAHADDGLFAVDNNSGTNTNTSCTNNRKDKHLFYNYNVNVPAGSTILGIEVRLDAKVDSTSGAPKICVQLSWNGGTSWTTAKQTSTLTTAEATYILGGAADTWGRAWGVADFSNTNFRVRVIDVASSTARDFSLDWVAVRVTYR
jgi:hypothetical protein